MNRKRLLAIAAPLGMLIACAGVGANAKNLQPESPTVTVSAFNDSDISPELVRQAETVASQVFEESGIHLVWLDCPRAVESSNEGLSCAQAIFLQHIHLHLERRAPNLSDAVLGVSYLSTDGTGCQADIFYEGIEKLHRETLLDPAIILGHVAAHEIGHLLLGNNSHSPWGIMRAHWDMGELVRAKKGSLFFTRTQSRSMRQKLWASASPGKWPWAKGTALVAED